MTLKEFIIIIFIIIKILTSSSEYSEYKYSAEVKDAPVSESDSTLKYSEEDFPNSEVYGFSDSGIAMIEVYSYYYVDPADGKCYFPEDREIIDYLAELAEIEEMYHNPGSDGQMTAAAPAVSAYIQKQSYKYGLIDTDYNIILEPVYDEITPLDEDFGRFRFSLDGEFFIGNQKGENLMGTTYDMISYSLGNGFSGVFKDGKFGYIDEETYEEVIPVEYDLIGSFNEGYASVIDDDELFFIDTDGEKIDAQMLCDKMNELNQIHFFDEYCRQTYIYETDTEKKIEKYLTCLSYISNDDPNEKNVSKDDFSFTTENYMQLPFDIYTGDMMAVTEKYSHNPQSRTLLDYDPVKDTYHIIPTGFSLPFYINYVITDISETEENVYTVTTVPIFMKSPLYHDSEEVYFIGADGEIYFIDSFIPDEIKSTFSEMNKVSNYYYDIRDSEEYFAILENECRENTDKYLTYTFTLRISDGGIVYFEDMVQS